MSDKAVRVFAEALAEELLAWSIKLGNGEAQRAVATVKLCVQDALARVAGEEGARGEWCQCGYTMMQARIRVVADDGVVHTPDFCAKPAPTPAPERCAHVTIEQHQDGSHSCHHCGKDMTAFVRQAQRNTEPPASQPASGNERWLAAGGIEGDLRVKLHAAERELAEAKEQIATHGTENCHKHGDKTCADYVADAYMLRADAAEALTQQLVKECDEANGLQYAAEARCEALRKALEHAAEWMAYYGCDCGNDEPGTCGLCVATAALAAAQKGEKK